ncbi:MAG: ADP-glyceromanno-heptose 6-epimerase [Candidatus Eremiobacteraeota bacterium]|nr:ADP-glyceromanno-heptose 6-epimerase [Candidatus Eremiobacteraeota bacterium]
MKRFGQGRTIVTGGAGFIGSALVWALNRRGIDDILVVDRLHVDEKWKNLVPLRFADYVDADEFEQRIQERPRDFSDVQCCFHLGACSSTTETDAAYLMRNNFEYTKHLAHWALESQTQFIYASSAATYGALEDNLSEERPLHTLRPLNMYAYSKHLFDLYAERQGWLDRITGLKYFNVFGPNEQHKGDMRSVVHKAFAQIRERGSVKLFRSYRAEFADGKQERDFIYVKDAVEMTLHLAQTGSAGIFNIGSGLAHTWVDLVGPIFETLGLPAQIEFIDMPGSLREKYQYSTRAATERLRASGYAGRMTPLRSAVGDYVENYLIEDRRMDPEVDATAGATGSRGQRTAP